MSLTRLGDALDFEEILSSIQKIKGSRPAAKRDTRQSWANLTPSQLHEKDLLITSGEYLECVNLPYCGHCENGWLYTLCESGYRSASLCNHCERPRRRLQRLSKAQLPVDAIDATIDQYEWDSTAQYEAVFPFAHWRPSKKSDPNKQRPPSILMHGTPGNGKTTLLYSIAKEAVWNGLKVRFTTHERLFTQERRSWDDKSIESPFKFWLKDVDLLLLDELGGLGGQDKVNGWYLDQTRKMIGAIHERWKGGKMAVMIATNLSPKEILVKTFNRSEALKSRAKDLWTDEKIIEMTGPDRRSQQTHKTKWDI